MSKVLVNESSLTGIANAIRGKNGSTTTYKPSEMAEAITAISGGGGSGPEIPEEAFVISGDCGFWDYGGKWDNFIKAYSDKWSTNNITKAYNMFYNSNLETIPFDFNFKNDNYDDQSRIFHNCTNLKSIGRFIDIYPNDVSYMFYSCKNLRYLPEFVNPNFNRINTYTSAGTSSMFFSCYSLRTVPEGLLNQIYGVWTSYYSTPFINEFDGCCSLDEIRGLNPQTGTITRNMFNNTFAGCSRAKNIIFKLQDDGTPYVVRWKTQTMSFVNNVGYASSINKMYLLNYNSGITADKEVTDDATYQALKNDPDWFTTKIEYSRYNHDSAVATINSLPDTSAYLASAGGTNTISFEGASGSATDGGAISSLTTEEIAVATARGWTVSII